MRTTRASTFLATLACAVLVWGCAGGQQDTARGRLCGDTNGSLVALAKEIDRYDGESGLTVFGPRLNTLDADLGALDLSGDAAAARDRAVSALHAMQSAAENRTLDAGTISAAADSLFELDSVICS